MQLFDFLFDARTMIKPGDPAFVGTVNSFPQRWLLLTGKWWILTIKLETILEFVTEIRKLYPIH